MFQDAGNQVYRKEDLGSLLEEFRDEGKVAIKTSVDEFAAFLQERGVLREIRVRKPIGGYLRRYYWGELSPYRLGLTIRPRSYLSHGTAVLIHGLNEQLPRVVYVNQEQSSKGEAAGPLLQQNVDRAFGHPQRTSKYSFQVEGHDLSFTLLSGKNTKNYGVESRGDPLGCEIRVTGLERTLIDIVVRPAYAGGVAQVLESFVSARGRVTGKGLVATLRRLNHFYPYHQALGFYMSRAGFDPEELDVLNAIPRSIRFYLTHAMRRMQYDDDWMIYYPMGL